VKHINTSHNFSWILLLFFLTPFWRHNYLVLSCTYLMCEGICNCPCSSMVGIMEVNLSVGRKYRKVRWDNFHTKRWRWGIWHCALYLARINRTTSWQQKKLLSGIYKGKHKNTYDMCIRTTFSVADQYLDLVHVKDLSYASTKLNSITNYQINSFKWNIPGHYESNTYVPVTNLPNFNVILYKISVSYTEIPYICYHQYCLHGIIHMF